MFSFKRIKIADIIVKEFKGNDYIILVFHRTRKGYKDKQEKYSLGFYAYGKNYSKIKNEFNIGDIVNIKFRLKSNIFIDRVSTSMIVEEIILWVKQENSKEKQEYFKNIRKYL